MIVIHSMMTYAKTASRWSRRTAPIAARARRKMDADFGDMPGAGWSNGSSPGFNGSAASLSAGSSIRRTSLASCNSLASSSSSNDFEIGSRLIAFASAYIIALTILPYFLKLPSGTTDLYNFVTVTLSIAILVSSLLQKSSAGAVNAEQHHRSGLEINELGRELSLRMEHNVSEDDAVRFVERYNAICKNIASTTKRLIFGSTRSNIQKCIRGLVSLNGRQFG